jgi:N-acetylglutamate synthase-like GNAT family acetyltransferase
MEDVAMERTIEVTGISDELLARLDQRAREIGVDRDSLLRKVIERAVAPPSSAATMGELLAPIHDFTEARGFSEAEIERFFGEQLADSRRQRRRADERGGSN